MNARVAGVVLAGGLSRRMGGGDKSLLPFAGATMLSHVIGRLRPQVDDLALNANGDPSRFTETGLPVIADPVAGFAGPLAGVLAGLNWISTIEPAPGHIVTVASDTPFFPADLVERFHAVNDCRKSGIVLATSGGNRHPVCGLWPLRLRDDLAAFLSNAKTFKVMTFANRHDVRFADFPLIRVNGETVDPFFNANTLDDLDAAEKIALEMNP